MHGVQPDNTDQMPLRTSPGMVTLVIRFVGSLIVAVVVMALLWGQ